MICPKRPKPATITAGWPCGAGSSSVLRWPVLGAGQSRWTSFSSSGVAAMERATTRLSLAIISVGSRLRAPAWVNSTKANSPPWLSSRPNRRASRPPTFNARAMPNSTRVLIPSRAAPMARIDQGEAASRRRSMVMPMAMKNSPSSMPLNG